MTLDHVTYAFSDLTRAARMFAGLGLRPDYGGPHSNGVTHMASIGFADGAYIELISTIAPGRRSPVWPRHVALDAGACAWAISVHDIEHEVMRIRELGVAATAPVTWRRDRPDGIGLEWKLAFLGAHEPGALLPFLIEDVTPRPLRVQPSASVAEHDADGSIKAGGLSGIAHVVLAVTAIAPAVELFHRVFGCSASRRGSSARLGAELAALDSMPVVLAAPADEAGWLAQRLARVGGSPCACLASAPDLSAAASRFEIAQTEPWLDQSAAWIDPTRLLGAMIGVAGSAASAGGEVF